MGDFEGLVEGAGSVGDDVGMGRLGAFVGLGVTGAWEGEGVGGLLGELVPPAFKRYGSSLAHCEKEVKVA